MIRERRKVRAASRSSTSSIDFENKLGQLRHQSGRSLSIAGSGRLLNLLYVVLWVEIRGKSARPYLSLLTQIASRGSTPSTNSVATTRGGLKSGFPNFGMEQDKMHAMRAPPDSYQT